MSRILKTSGFLGLAVMMTVGLYQVSLLAGGGGPPGWLVGTHAHLGVLSIIAIVTGFAVDAFDLAGTLRNAVVGLYVAGQWLLPASIWLGEGREITIFLPSMYLWGTFLIVAMVLMAWQAAISDAGGRAPGGVAPADD